MVDALTQQVSQIGTKGLARVGSLIGIGVETFEIDPTYGGELDPVKSRLTIGFTPERIQNLYTYYRGGINQSSQIGFEYRFNKSVLMEGRRDQNELYQLNLKLHWEL